jgi:hypothetical protein
MSLSEFYDAVARRADTDTTKISAAETRRVLSEAFRVLAGMDAATVADVIAKGLANAKQKNAAAAPVAAGAK